MSAELVGILSVGATLVVSGLATAGAIVGLILRLHSRSNARMDRMDARMDRMESRMETLESRQYDLVQAVVRMDASQQAMMETLARIEERTRPDSDRPAQPTLFDAGSAPTDNPRQSAPASAQTPA